MNLREAIKGQYHAGLGMLDEVIEKCPDELWEAGRHPRPFWRVAYHALFYTHLYILRHLDDFVRWEHHRENAEEIGFGEIESEVAVVAPYQKEELRAYLREIDGRVDATIDEVDLDAEDCGFYWYHLSKLDHELMNLRHLQQHVGQLSERLIDAGVDLSWKGRRDRFDG